MTAELRNLPHIASMAFNEPLMLEPAYARVFFCALAGQLGISRLTDAVSGDSLTAGEAPAALALSGDDDGPRQARSYQVMNGIAVLPVSGTLVSRTRALQPYSGMTGYNGIIARLQQAASDPMVDGILLDMDTPGGMVAGAFDCADIIARVRDIKPVWALANDMNCSAGQLLASAASRRLVTQTARTGSIGVMMAHSNYGAALEKQGVEITLIYSIRWMATPTAIYRMMSGKHCSPGWMQPAGCLHRRCRHIPACPCRLCWIPRLQCTAVRRPLMPDWLMNL
ncbi:minor capsid protein C from bacteriophage origin [Escherichia coli]|nr:minor capsid protein C from bacteriophage origin [Escherichia coli]SQR15356.1 minor capsid protein C from bacteriophage origin [Escherichia coli]